MEQISTAAATDFKLPYYRPVGKEIEVFAAARRSLFPVLLKGPTGCGKSRFVEHMAKENKVPLIQVACNEDTSSSDLLGRFLIKDGDTIWQDGPVSRAVRTGALLYLDEVAEAREDVIVLLHSLADHRRQIYLDRTNETLSAPAGFQLVVSFNPGYQNHFRKLKPSTRQRFITLEFTYPVAEIEIEILEAETGLTNKTCSILVGLAKKIRTMKELALKETISTRLLIHAARLMREGLAPRLACEVGILQALTDETETTRALQDLVSLHF
jgi:nitric oxide reductase NorQ protein